MITEEEILDFIGPPLESKKIVKVKQEKFSPFKECMKCNLPMPIEHTICPHCHIVVGSENDVYSEMARRW
jgi:hypothetical protein